MKGSEFVKLLRKVIREEVRTVVKEELKSIKPLLEVSTKQQKPTKAVQPQTKTKYKPSINVNVGGAIGDILRETAESMYKNPIEDEWPDAFGGPMTTDNLGSFGSNPLAFDGESSVGTNAGVDLSGAPFLKDYSKVLKSAEAIAQRNRDI